jgi:hypothetical protein
VLSKPLYYLDEVFSRFEAYGFDAVVFSTFSKPFERVENKMMEFKDGRTRFEDVTYYGIDSSYYRLYVEVKPTLGEDYPAVLRQMDSARKVADREYLGNAGTLLLVGRYVGQAVTFDQVRRFFGNSGVSVMTFAEVLEGLGEKAPPLPSIGAIGTADAAVEQKEKIPSIFDEIARNFST